jgi:hypothetical protein
MNSWNWGCYNDGASVYCCDATSYTTIERLSPGLQAFSDAMDRWLSTPACVEGDYMYQSLKRAEETCSFPELDTIVNRLGDMLEEYDHFDSVRGTATVEIWDKVQGYFPYLVSDLLFPWITSNRTYPEYTLSGSIRTAEKIIRTPMMFNRMVGDLDTTVWCPVDLCELLPEWCAPDEEEMDGDEEDPDLQRRKIEWNEKACTLHSSIPGPMNRVA